MKFLISGGVEFTIAKWNLLFQLNLNQPLQARLHSMELTSSTWNKEFQVTFDFQYEPWNTAS